MVCPATARSPERGYDKNSLPDTKPLPVEIDSFNAQPETPAFVTVGPEQADAYGWVLNEQTYQSPPAEDYHLANQQLAGIERSPK